MRVRAAAGGEPRAARADAAARVAMQARGWPTPPPPRRPMTGGRSRRRPPTRAPRRRLPPNRPPPPRAKPPPPPPLPRPSTGAFRRPPPASTAKPPTGIPALHTPPRSRCGARSPPVPPSLWRRRTRAPRRPWRHSQRDGSIARGVRPHAPVTLMSDRGMGSHPSHSEADPTIVGSPVATPRSIQRRRLRPHAPFSVAHVSLKFSGTSVKMKALPDTLTGRGWGCQRGRLAFTPAASWTPPWGGTARALARAPWVAMAFSVPQTHPAYTGRPAPLTPKCRHVGRGRTRQARGPADPPRGQGIEGCIQSNPIQPNVYIECNGLRRR